MKRNPTFLKLFTAALVASAAMAQAPAISPGGAVNAADYSPNLAPGSIISIFGSNLATIVASAAQLPLPNSLSGVSVEAGSGGSFQSIPLFYVSPKQINAQLPYSLMAGPAQLRIRTAAGTSNPEPITIAARAPKFFTFDFSGQGPVVAQTADFATVTDANPAKPAGTVIFYLNSAGALDQPIVAGDAAPGLAAGSTLARISDTVTMKIDGQDAPVTYAGLAPGFSGLYQINAKMPFIVATGPLNVQITVGTSTTQTTVTQAKVTTSYRQLGFYFALLGGKPVAGSSLNAQAGSVSALAFRQTDQVSWGAEGFQAWSKNTGLGAQYASSPGLALTLRNGSTVVYDNNGIEDRSFGSFYDNTNGGSNSLRPGLANVYSMSNYFPLVFVTDFKLTQRTTITELVGYFDGDGNSDLPFDPQNPYVQYRMNIWSNLSGNVPKDTTSYVGDVFSSDTVSGTATISDTGARRIFTDPTVPGRNVPDAIYRVSYKLTAPLTLEAGDYWFSHDVSVRSSPGTSSTSAAVPQTPLEIVTQMGGKRQTTESTRPTHASPLAVRPTAAVGIGY